MSLGSVCNGRRGVAAACLAAALLAGGSALSPARALQSQDPGETGECEPVTLAAVHILDAPVGEDEAVLYRSTANLTPVYAAGNTHDSHEYKEASFSVPGVADRRLPALDRRVIGHLATAVTAADSTIPLTSVSGLRAGDSIEVGSAGELMRIAGIDAANNAVTVVERYRAHGGSFVGPQAWPAGTFVFHHRRARPERLPGYLAASGQRPHFDNFRLSWEGLDVPYLAMNLVFPGGDTELEDWEELLVYLRLRRADGQGRTIEGLLPVAADGELSIGFRQPGDPYTIREQHLRHHLGWPHELDDDPDGVSYVAIVDDDERAARFVEGPERTFLQEMIDWIYADDGHDLGRIYPSDDRYSADERAALRGSPHSASEQLVRSYQILLDVALLDGTDSRIDSESLSIGAAPVTEPRPNRPATGPLTITGMAQVGVTLTADTSCIDDADGLHDAVFAYQWLADGVHIAAAAGDRYTLAATDEGATITVTVTFTDDAGHSETLTSAPTEAVATLPRTPEPDPLIPTLDPEPVPKSRNRPATATAKSPTSAAVAAAVAAAVVAVAVA